MKDYSLLFMRHGHTLANERGLCSGAFCNEGLTELGRKQAETSAKSIILSGHLPKVIYASPAIRVRETLSILQQNNCFASIKVNFLDDLRERHFGSWEGKKFDLIKEDLESGKIGDEGEEQRSFIHRIKKVFKQIQNDSKNVGIPLVISHGLVWQTLHDLEGASAPWILNGDVFLVKFLPQPFESRRITTSI